MEVSQDSTFRPLRNHTLFVGQKFGLSAFAEMPEGDFAALVQDNPELEASLRTLAEYALLHHHQTDGLSARPSASTFNVFRRGAHAMILRRLS